MSNFKSLKFALTYGIAAVALNATGALAQQRTFDIPSQPAIQSIPEFARQAGIQIVAPAARLSNISTSPLKGDIEVRTALVSLLKGTGLEVASDEGSVIALRANAIQETPPSATRPKIQLAQASPSAQAPVSSGQQAQGLQLEEIVVQARRVDENLQRVPISITAFTPEVLKQQDLRDIFTMSRSIGGLNMVGPPGAATPGLVWLHGALGVVFYFGDIPVSGSSFAYGFDLSGAQVVNGPQGTLFGTASNAGAIVYTPKKPSDHFEGFASVTGGDYGRRNIEGALNLPIVDDKLIARIGAQDFHRDGYVLDIKNGKKYLGQDYWIGRGSLVFRPTDKVENYFLFNYYHFHNDGNWTRLIDYDPKGTPVTLLGLAKLDAVTAEQIALGPYKVNGLSINGGNVFNWEWRAEFVNTTTWDILDNLSVKNIFGYRLNRSFAVNDTDGTNVAILDDGKLTRNTAPPETAIWSDEIQFSGKLFSNRLSYRIGTFHTGTQSPNGQVVFAGAFGATSASIDKSFMKSRAVYGQGTLDLSEFLSGLSVTAGYRYTWDSIGAQNYRLTVTAAPPDQLKSNRDLKGAAKFAKGSYTVSAQYQFTPDIMFFFTDSKGYSAGQLGLTAPPPLVLVRPEALDQIEGGVKSTFDIGDVKVRANLSGFYGWYTDVKVLNGALVQVQPPPAPPSFFSVTQNAGAAHIKGFDGDFAFIPRDDLEIGGFFNYTHDNFTNYPSIDTLTLKPIDLSSTPFLFTPKFKWGAHFTYHLPIDSSWGDISITPNLTHTGSFWVRSKPIAQEIKSWVQSVANGYGPLTAAFGQTVEVDAWRGHYDLNLSIDWRGIHGVEGLNGQVFVNNVTDNNVANGGIGGVPGIRAKLPAEPRMFGARLSYSF